MEEEQSQSQSQSQTAACWSRGGKQGSREAGKQGKRRWGIGQAASGRQQAQQRAGEAAAMAKPAERERERDVFVYHGMMHIGS
jgi:hypothetical protein